MTSPRASSSDPLLSLREYRQLAPWNLRDLAGLAGAILDAAAVRPLNAAASAHPSERTIRFYVTRRLVASPEGRGTAATYSYRHLLQVLAIKLRQMEGATLSGIGSELAETSGDVLERRVAAALGDGLPPPAALPLLAQDDLPRGRAGQRFRPLQGGGEDAADGTGPRSWRRLPVSDGVELHVREDHAVLDNGELERPLAEAVRLAIGRLLAQPGTQRASPEPTSRTERTTHLA